MSDEKFPEVMALGSDPWPQEEAPRTLLELLNRVLDRGVVLRGDVTISLAGVDLVYLGLNTLLTSVATARETLGRDVGPRRLPSSSAAQVSPSVIGEPSRPSSVSGRPAVSPAVAEAAAGGRPAPAPGTASGEDPVQAALAEVARVLPSRIDVDPEAVQRDLARLVLTLVELLRRVVEHQAIRRMDDPDLSAEQVERMGIALEKLEEKLAEIREVFGLAEGDLDVDLGPLGKLF
jgi:hypothetical protein